jgi:Zn-dependent protease/CBS domain-containing protein
MTSGREIPEALQPAGDSGTRARSQDDMTAMRFARIAGIDVYVDWSLLIIFLLISGSLASGVFPAWHPDWPPALAWLTAVAAALLFFTSVLVHELSHALVGRRYGIPVRRITLFVFGGVAQIEHEPDKWRAELWTAIVGPITSLVLGLLCIFAATVLFVPSGAPARPFDADTAQAFLAQLGPVATLLLWLGQVNIVLAVFNMVPGFPLDGGRVLRALMWGITGDLRRATRWASTLGQAFAWLLIIAGVAMILGVYVPFFGSGTLNGLWLAFIGWFLHNAARMSYRQLLTREALQDLPVSRLMLTHYDAVTPDMNVAELIDEHLIRSGLRALPVMSDNRLVGMANLEDAGKIPPASRATTTVREIMTPIEQVQTVRPEDEALDVLSLFARPGVSQLPVIGEGRLQGLIRREDILRWLALHDGASAHA